MKRDPHSHKGENGKVAIIGGSLHQHGAPIFSALSAEASGVDLIFLALPSLHQEVARSHSLNFQVHPFQGDELSKGDVRSLLEMLATVDSAVIGPGLSRTPAALEVIRELIEGATCPLVLDASALQPWTLEVVREKTAVLTPHLGELERMGLTLDDVASVTKNSAVTIHVKSETDITAAHGKIVQETGDGNAGLTHGGTGDALAGLIAGLIAQKVDPPQACALAATVIKRAGVILYGEKGYAYTTQDVIAQIPHLLHAL